MLQGRSLDDTLKQVALALPGAALEASLKPLVSLIENLAGSLAGTTGNLFGQLLGLTGSAKGGVVPFASGGVAATPSYFLGNGGLGHVAGAEAILPLGRTADGSLGVRGGGGSVNVTFNVTTPNADSFRQSEAQLGVRQFAPSDGDGAGYSAEAQRGVSSHCAFAATKVAISWRRSSRRRLSSSSTSLLAGSISDSIR